MTFSAITLFLGFSYLTICVLITIILYKCNSMLLYLFYYKYAIYDIRIIKKIFLKTLKTTEKIEIYS
jgi:hypothetical protein